MFFTQFLIYISKKQIMNQNSLNENNNDCYINSELKHLNNVH